MSGFKLSVKVDWWFMMDKNSLKEKVLKHSENGNLEKANSYLDKYVEHDDTSDEEIELLIKKALLKARDADTSRVNPKRT